ncbi:MAG TPA: L-2-amino-thiazoline-4-carboxylic acid hydrolase [Anaerolineales bacterium]|nr:L-2-amino-thiazoline-4-carboxylic acid hydrolase [Anaerolineales bacterium]
MTLENWYLRNKPRIMREIKFAIPRYKKFLVQAYGMGVAKIVVQETLQRFEDLLPDLPYIGGDENILTENLYLSAAMLAMYQSLKARGKSVEEVAGLIYQGTSKFYTSFPFRLLLLWQGRQLFSQKRLDQRRHDAAISQARRYPEDWVFEIVEGDGQSFQFGVDYTECGIVKYLTRQGAPELAPYLCWLDYPMCAAMRVKLFRTETIAQGCEKCNFRFSRGQALDVKPDFLKN